MESVILTSGRNYDAEINSRLRLLSGVHVWSDESSWTVDDGSTSIYIQRVDCDVPVASPDVASPLFARFPEPVYYVVDYRDIGLCGRFLVAVVNAEDLVVDSDFGFVALGSDFVKRILKDPLWDWRSRG